MTRDLLAVVNAIGGEGTDSRNQFVSAQGTTEELDLCPTIGRDAGDT